MIPLPLQSPWSARVAGLRRFPAYSSAAGASRSVWMSPPVVGHSHEFKNPMYPHSNLNTLLKLRRGKKLISSQQPYTTGYQFYDLLSCWVQISQIFWLLYQGLFQGGCALSYQVQAKDSTGDWTEQLLGPFPSVLWTVCRAGGQENNPGSTE